MIFSGTINCQFLTHQLRPGDTGGAVALLQNFLILQGFEIPSGTTGFYGAQTREAVSKFQIKYSGQILFPQRLSYPTGNVGPGTLAQINALYCNT